MSFKLKYIDFIKKFPFYRSNEDTKILLGNIRSEILKEKSKVKSIRDAEFKVFSQWGDDGIIQYLVQQIEMPKIFIEFGVEFYLESNTRFLLMNNNWQGLIIDGSKKYIDSVKKDRIYWQYDLTAISAFITSENINQLFEENNFIGEVGILSIDIDGNDYYVWDAINVVNPVVVIVEYNAVLGSEYPISIPYQADFVRSKSHYSNLYWGTSLKALCHLAEQKGYYFIGCNQAGNNGYFVRKDKITGILPVTIQEGFVDSNFRESRFTDGKLSLLKGKDRLNLIKDMPVFDVISKEKILLKNIFNL